MKCILSASLFVFCAFALGPAGARASTASGHITKIEITPENSVFIWLDTDNRTAMPSCANPDFRLLWAFDVSTDRGKALLGASLTARAQNMSVTIDGSGSCSPGRSGGDVKNINWLHI